MNQVSSQRCAGRLKYFYDQWATVTANLVVLRWTQGYIIPFTEIPVQTEPPSSKILTPSEFELLRREIIKLKEKGAIERCKPVKNQFVSKVFLTDKSNGEKRFILNLKQLNVYLNVPHFKMEDTRTAARLIRKNGFIASIDLKDAYYLIPIHEKYKRFLRFIFDDKLYQFCCLPFGLASAPYMFTKLLRPVVERLRTSGVTCVSYLDDFLLLGSTENECLENVQKTVSLLQSLGFIINIEKSNFTPSTRGRYLGFVFDTKRLTLELPQEKRNRIVKWIDVLRPTKRCRIRKFARFLGILTSACPAIKYGWLYTKCFERQKFLALRRSQGDYEAYIEITQDIIDDMIWWRQNINSCNDLKNDSFELEIFTDASLSGWGVYCLGEKTHGWWTDVDEGKHINILELKAIHFGLKCFARNLKNCNVLIRTDNTTALACVNRMGSIQHQSLNNLARQIWKFCELRNIYIFASYIRSSSNTQADEASRVLRSDTEWSLNKATGILVVPFWQSQSWYPLFIKMIIGQPLFFGPKHDILFCPYSKQRHPLSQELTLVAARLSGKHLD